MSTYDNIIAKQREINSMLCVGIDPDMKKLPLGLAGLEGVKEFCFNIIESTKDIVCSYKFNFAFFEVLGYDGIKLLKSLFDYVGVKVPIIADAKRGDIGNSSKAYADSIFGYFDADGITVSPYMGYDSILPFLEYKDRLTFVLALTSNEGSNDFQQLTIDGEPLYKHIIYTCNKWADDKTLGYVAGATKSYQLLDARSLTKNRFLLIPGIGAQGGDEEQVMRIVSGTPAIINVSRSVLYASNGSDYAAQARNKSIEYNKRFFK